MAYQSGKTYYLVPRFWVSSTTSRENILNKKTKPLALNTKGTGSHYNNRNCNLWTLDYSTDMQWKVEIPAEGGYARILCAGDTSYGLDYYHGEDDNGNCDIYKVAGNENDSKVNFITVNATENLYKIQCYKDNTGNNLYLTAMGNSDSKEVTNGTDVRWQALNSSKTTFQIWWLLPVEDVKEGETAITGATVENLNQNNYGNQAGENTFCYATCILALVRHYKGSSFTMDRLINEGIVRASDGLVLKNSTQYYNVTSDTAANYSIICNEIANGRPVIIHGKENNKTHFVVADGFTSRTKDGIIVMDPWTGTHTKLTGSVLRTYSDNCIFYRKYNNI